MAGETDLDDPLKLDKATKSGGHFSSPSDDNDLVRGVVEMTSSEDEVREQKIIQIKRANF